MRVDSRLEMSSRRQNFDRTVLFGNIVVNKLRLKSGDALPSFKDG